MQVIKQSDTNEDCAKTLASTENKLAEDANTSFIEEKSVKDRSPPKQGVKRVNGDLIPLSADVNLGDIIDSCPPHLSGADFYSLCSNAVIQRVEKNVSLLEKGEKTIEELNSDVRTEDFLSAMKTLVPSVSPEQFEQYKSIKSKIEKE
ncbi:hypothetical protein AVEN_162312-1 [Araneus ventricosus]|uniref:Uncharacterized protein n=1 Tax=Araneus ventricosus TaxID=182803 RepID=A0A4Y2LUR6_ARAVE|nr:hypothetical protein AVEN_162312-1 [Araneus ventricosus]